MHKYFYTVTQSVKIRDFRTKIRDTGTRLVFPVLSRKIRDGWQVCTIYITQTLKPTHTISFICVLAGSAVLFPSPCYGGLNPSDSLIPYSVISCNNVLQVLKTFSDVVWHASWSITGDILAVSGGDNKVCIINPRRSCAERVTVVVSCVCVCVCVCVSVCLNVCLYEHAILAVCAIRSITKDAIVLSVRFAAILKRRFSLNCLNQKLERFSLTSAGAAIFSWCLLRMQCFVYSVTCLLTRKAWAILHKYSIYYTYELQRFE